MTATANHALQRTAPGVTAHAPTTFAPAAFPHGLRRPPQSLSLGSLGVATPVSNNDTKLSNQNNKTQQQR
jgi:hypothetical protein